MIQPFLATAVTTWCSLPLCPSMTRTYIYHMVSHWAVLSKTTLLMHPFKNGSIQGRVSSRENLQTSLQLVYLVTQIQPFCDDGTQFVSWHCSGVRTSFISFFRGFRRMVSILLDSSCLVKSVCVALLFPSSSEPDT